MTAFRAWVWVSAVVGIVASPGIGVTISTAPVRHHRTRGEFSGYMVGGSGSDRICGSVGYAYNIGKYEVTAGQYTEFLNKVAGTDTEGP